MDIQKLMDFVTSAANLHDKVGFARTVIQPNQLYTNLELVSRTYQGEQGYISVSGQQRMITNIAVIITDSRVEEGDLKPYYGVQKRGEEINRALQDAQLPQGVINVWIDDEVYEVTSEQSEKFVVEGALSVMILHEVD